MWSPADLFTPALSIFLFPLKRAISYFYEHLMVLAIVLLAIAVLITAVTMVGDQLRRRT